MGARRRRQGTGEWVARAFHRSGHDIVGIVGTTEETLATARRALFDRHGIRAAGYLSLDDLLLFICRVFQHQADLGGQLEVPVDDLAVW